MQIEQLIRDEWPLSGTCVTYLILDVLSYPLSFFLSLSKYFYFLLAWLIVLLKKFFQNVYLYNEFYFYYFIMCPL